jgi:hypothetical protein
VSALAYRAALGDDHARKYQSPRLALLAFVPLLATWVLMTREIRRA